MSPLTNGEWQQVSLARPIDAIFTARPALRFRVDFACAAGCPGAEVHFDDLVFEQTPTAVTIAAIRAQHTRSGIRLGWRTASEARLLGFNIYREQKGRLVRLNRTMIPSVFGGTVSGCRYSFLDRSAPSGKRMLRYRLQAVTLDGTRSWIGSATVAH
jgi:hypothetical protein